MSIEFHCFHCNRLLKTDEDKAGLQCECPECHRIIIVPDPASQEKSVPEEYLNQEEDHELHDGSFIYDSRKQKPDRLPGNSCPQCMVSLNPEETVCPSCGFVLRKRFLKPVKPKYKINANQVLQRTLETFKARWSLCITGIFVFLILWFGIRVFNGLALNNPPMISTLLTVGGLFLQVMLLVGVHILFLNIATDNNPQLNDLISGGQYLFRYFANMIVVGVLIAIGLFCFVLPGIFVAVISAPLGYVIVDQNLPGLLSIRKCLEITSGNRWGLFLLVLVAFGMLLWGIVALFVGLLIALPLVNLLFAVSYCEMTGQ
jgi:phage FluMu protein Com